MLLDEKILESNDYDELSKSFWSIQEEIERYNALLASEFDIDRHAQLFLERGKLVSFLQKIVDRELEVVMGRAYGILYRSDNGSTPEAPEQEREEETADALTEDRKAVYYDDYHVRFLRSEVIMIQRALYYYGANHSLHNEDKLLFEYVSKLVNMAVLREYDSAVLHVDCDPSPDDDWLS